MITSDNIMARSGASSGMFNTQSTPYVYGTPHAGFQHGSPQGMEYGVGGYGMANQMGGFAAGAVGVSGVQTLMGMGLAAGMVAPRMLGGFGKGWGLAGNAFARGFGGQATLNAMQTAPSMMQAASIGGRGLMSGALRASPYALAAYAGYKGFSMMGQGIYGGARFQQDSERIMARHLQFTAGSTSRTGMGLSEKEMRGVTGMVMDMAGQDTLRSKNELMRVMDKLGQRDFFQDVRSAGDFKRKFKGMVKTLKTVAQAFGSSLEEAVPLLDQMRRSGVYGQQAQGQLATKMRLSGISTQAGMNVMAQGSAIARAGGGMGSAGAKGALSTLEQIKTAQTMIPGMGNLLTEMTGGLTGTKARQAATGQMMQMTSKFLRGPLGRLALAGMVNKDFTGMDQGMVQKLASGEISINELYKKGMANTASFKNKARFINREGDLRSMFMKQSGPMGMALLVNAAVKSKILSGSSDADVQEIIMKRFTGGNRRQAQFLMKMARNLPKIRQEMTRNTMRQMETQNMRVIRREHYSLDAIKRRGMHALRKMTVEPFEKIGANIYTGVTDAVRNWVDKRLGVQQATLTGRGKQAFLGMIQGGKDADKSFTEQFGDGTSPLSVSERDLTQVGGKVSGFAKTFLGLQDTPNQGAEIMKLFGRKRLLGMSGVRQTTERDLKQNEVIISRGRGQVTAIRRAKLRQLMLSERSNASGATGRQVLKQWTQAGKGGHVTNLANSMMSKILNDTSGIANKLQNGTPGEKREAVRHYLQKVKNNPAYRQLVKDMKAKGVTNVEDQILSGLNEKFEKMGFQRLNAFKTEDQRGALGAISTEEAKKNWESTMKELGGGSDQLSAGLNLGKYLWGESWKKNTKVLRSKLFQEITPLSQEVMSLVTGKTTEIDPEKHKFLSRLMQPGKGAMTFDIGGGKTRTVSADERKQLRSLINNLRKKRGKGGVDAKRAQRMMDAWRKGIQVPQSHALLKQIRTAGMSGFKGLVGAFGKSELRGSGAYKGVMEFFQRLEGATGADMKEMAASGSADFGRIMESISGLGKRKGSFLAGLAKTKGAGQAVVNAFHRYQKLMKKKGMTKEEASKQAMSTFFGGTLYKGSTTVGKAGSLPATLKVWNEYVKANMQFVQAVGEAVGNKKLIESGKKLQNQSRPAQRPA